MNDTKITGNIGEEMACEYLIKNGFHITHRNWRHKHWEIDIIATKNCKTHFIEVKARNTKAFGLPEESITQKKMDILKKGVAEFLNENPLITNLQIDVIAISLQKNKLKEIFYIEDVFF